MTQIQPNPEKVGHVVGEVAKLFQEKQCNPAEMGLVALYALQMMHQMGFEYKLDYPKTMTIQTPSRFEITYNVKPMGAGQLNLLEATMNKVGG